MDKSGSGALPTRRALVSAALKLFADHGYEAVSTRQIADHANANIGSIAYHYGGKPGLRIACVEYAILAMREELGLDFTQPLPAGRDPDTAADILAAMLAKFVYRVTQRADWPEIHAFVISEMAQPGDMATQIYAGMFCPLHERLCDLFSVATGGPEPSERIFLAVFALMGQAMYFRMCREMIVRRMNWADIGPRESEAIVRMLEGNVRALIDFYRGIDGASSLPDDA